MKIIYCIVKAIKLSCLLFIVLCSDLLFINSTLAVENKKNLFITGIQNEQTHVIAKNVLQEAYRRIGYKVRFKLLPGHRSMGMANNGESDGDIARIDGTQKKFTNLVIIPTPLIEFKGVVFTQNISKEISEWDDLKGLRIGIIRGIRYSEIGTQDLSPLFANDMTHLFKLLDQELIQVAIATSRAGRIELSKRFKKSGIRIIGKPLISAPLYHFVHKKNQSIITQLNTILQKMEEQDEIITIVESTFKSLLND